MITNYDRSPRLFIYESFKESILFDLFWPVLQMELTFYKMTSRTVFVVSVHNVTSSDYEGLSVP